MCTRRLEGRATAAWGQRGLTLVELIVAMVIIAVAVGGVLLAINQGAFASADPLVRKQALAIAESLLEEVESMPFTYCDPDDADAATATSAIVGAGGCRTTVEAMGAEAGEGRGNAGSPFDNVNDYNNYQTPAAGITDIFGAPVAGLAAYQASVRVADAGAPFNAGEALRIVVTVSGPANTTVTLTGLRARYAPNP